MRNISRAWCAAACFVVVAGGWWPESVVARAQTATPPEFPSQVALVTVDAVVVDGSGHSVEGLTRDDFTVEEDDQPQDIVNFEAVSAAPEADDVNAPGPSSIATSTAPALGPHRSFAILVDDLRLPGEETLRVRRVLASLIGESLGPGDAVILGTTSGEAWWSARMPEGRDDLLAVLDRVKGRYVDPSTREHMTEYEAFSITHREAGSPPHQTVLEALRSPSTVSERVALRLWDRGLCGTKEPPHYEACFPLMKSSAAGIDGARSQRTALTLRAMGRAVSALAPLHGRTSLVFLSPGFLQDEDLAPRDIASAALRARTAVYFVDTRGLFTGAPGAAASADLSSVEHPSGQAQKGLEERLESGGTEALAEETGGFSVHHTNDLAAATQRIAAESRTSYLLGFRPPAGKPANAWRKLAVRVNRSGLTVRPRRGYRLDAATTAAMNPSALDTVPLRLASYVLEPLPGDHIRVVAVTEIDISALGDHTAEGMSPALQLRIEATPRAGGEAPVQDVSLQSAQAGAGEGTRTGAEWRVVRLEFALPAGVHGIRAFVRDPSTGRTGAAEQRLVVPEHAAFRVSTPVLSNLVTTSPDAKSSLSPAPVAHDEFRPEPSHPLLVAFDVFGAAKNAATGRPNVETRFVLEDGEGRRLAAPPASALTPSPEGLLQQVLALPTLPGGDYELTITVEDRVAGNQQEVRRRFVVAGPAAVASAPAASSSGEAKAPTPELAAILSRAARYVVAYGQEFSNLVADDECQQIFEPDNPGRRAVRNTRGSAFFITLPGPLPWATFHDVWEVDGNKVRDRQERLGRLFRESPAAARERARAILEENARYNLGPVRRSVNIPTLALLFFHPDNQHRFAFEIKGRPSIPRAGVVEVTFREQGRPTLVAGDTSEGAPVKGRAWIDAEHGTVMKTDAEYDIDPGDHYHRSRARIVTEYRREPALGILVPDRMKETYTSLVAEGAGLKVLPNAHARSKDAQEESGVLTVEATTRYTAYHHYEVSTDEKYSAPQTPQ